MKRRDFIAGGALAVASGVHCAAAQQAKPVIGMLGPVAWEQYADRVALFRDGLKQAGFADPTGVHIEYLWPGPDAKPWSILADELVRRRVSVIATAGDLPPRAAKAATGTIPIVFVMGGDPVAQGLVPSLSRPAGNVTGVTTINVELAAKRLEIVRELLPRSTHVALLINPSSKLSAETLTRETERAAATRGFKVSVLGATDDRSIEVAFAELAGLRPNALIIGANVLFNIRSRQLASLAVHHAIPAIYQTREFAMAGGLLSYGASLDELFRLQGNYVGRILKGQSPTDLPVQQAARIQMVLNLKTAKALGIEVPTAVLVRADEVIE